jgi:hypothetical protein
MLSHGSTALRRLASQAGRGALALALLFAACVLPLYSQKGAQRGPEPPQTGPPPDFRDAKAPNYGPAAPRTPTFQEMQYRRYVESRLQSLLSDADRLLKLAEELNREADTPQSDSSSREDAHKVAEIEKLAHNVKWKMQLVVNQDQ